MITLGLVIRGKTELIWYGCEIPPARREELIRTYKTERRIEILDVWDEVFSGLKIDDPARLVETGLVIKYFFPDEEKAARLAAARTVDLDRVKVTVRKPPRKKCEPGHVYVCGGDFRRGYTEIRHFRTPFFPPFKSEDVSLYIDDLSDFGYDGYYLADLKYDWRDAAYVETEAKPLKRLDTKFLAD
ncbi:MAG: hypothetical protein AB1641_30565 [Thermodesulfobacteriota bacterium]